MYKQNEELFPKASKQYEPPSSKVMGEIGATLLGVGATASAVKEGLTLAIGSLVTVGPGAGVSMGDASTGNSFGHQDP